MHGASPRLDGGLEIEVGSGAIAHPIIEVLQHLGSGLIALRGVTLQTLTHNVAQRRGDSSIMVGNRNGALLIALNQAGDGAFRLVRHFSGKQFVEN